MYLITNPIIIPGIRQHWLPPCGHEYESECVSLSMNSLIGKYIETNCICLVVKEMSTIVDFVSLSFCIHTLKELIFNVFLH
jgi:hypothetical protein